MKWILRRLLPGSLIGRVFALYCLALLVFVGGGLAVSLKHQYEREIERTLWQADAIAAITATTVTDSAVIGDYDTIQRTLEKAIYRTDFTSSTFIDLKGGRVTATHAEPVEVPPPQWLRSAVAEALYDINVPISAGGRDYGILRLTFGADHIAGSLWKQARYALLIAVSALVGGLVLIRFPLVQWLGNLGEIQFLQEIVRSGRKAGPLPSISKSAPIELRRTYEALSRAAQTMQAEREQAEVTLGAIADAVFTLTPEGVVIHANAAAQTVFGQDPEAFIGRNVRELMPQLFLAGSALEPWNDRHANCLRPDGSTVVVDTTLSGIAGDNPGSASHVLTCRNVTEMHALNQRLSDEVQSREIALNALRRVLEGLTPQLASRSAADSDDLQAISNLISTLVGQLQEHGEQLAAIFELSPDGFVSFDAQRSVSYVSPTFTRLSGLPVAQVLGTNEAGLSALMQSLCGPSEKPFIGLQTMRELGESAAQRQLLELARPTQRVVELRLRQGASGAISQVLYLRDVTHEMEVDRMKNEFLSTAAHELRTPMASIFGFTELMMTRQLAPDRQRQVVEAVYRQSQQMIAIVNELLDLARIEARQGKDFFIEPLDLKALILESVRDFNPPSSRAAPQLAADEVDAVMVYADRKKTVQAITNVIANAYKYSPDGGDVHLRMVAAQGDQRGTHMGIEVRDHGIGMTPDQLARVGERFYRADTSGTIPGTGLGVSIVKEIMQLQGGSMDIESEFGQGTQVSLWWRLTPESVQQVDALQAA